MAFWSGWFKPGCPDCGGKIVGEPVDRDGRQLCAACAKKVDEAAAAKAAEVEARRQAEEEAYDRMMARRTFGTDPRYDEESR